VSFRSSRRRDGCRERAEGGGRRRPKPSPSTPALVMFLKLSIRGMDGVRRWGALGGEERGWGKNGV
jgi:hypothetical protein